MPRNGFDKIDADCAIKAAEQHLNKLPPDYREVIEEYIPLVMEEWKQQYGTQCKETKEKRLTHPEQLNRTAELEPWECTPAFVNKNPIELLAFISATAPRLLDRGAFLPGIAFLIVFCGQKKQSDWYQDMVKWALRLQDIDIQDLSDSNKLLKKIRESHENQSRGFSESRQARTASSTIKKKKVHQKADDLISRNVSKHEIIGIIHGKASCQEPISKRQIRRYLKDHKSGLWKPSQKK